MEVKLFEIMASHAKLGFLEENQVINFINIQCLFGGDVKISHQITLDRISGQ